MKAIIALTSEQLRIVLVALKQYRRFHTLGMESRCIALEVIELLDSSEMVAEKKTAGTKVEGSGV